jgi:hypothetical protein
LSKVDFEFIGSMTTGPQAEAKWPEPFDPHHEGRYGWKTEQVRDHPAVAMATALNTKASLVVAVDHYKGWVEDPSQPETDTFDWAHPNPRSQEKMAWNGFNAMRPYLKWEILSLVGSDVDPASLDARLARHVRCAYGHIG